jgi:nephrocystin-3
MSALKSRISKSGLPVRNYNSIENLGDLILRDLKCRSLILSLDLIKKADIDLDFPANEDPDPFEIENNSHEIYAEIRSKVYIGKSQYFNKIDRYLDEVAAVPLVVLGESGAGSLLYFVFESFVKRKKFIACQLDN